MTQTLLFGHRQYIVIIMIAILQLDGTNNYKLLEISFPFLHLRSYVGDLCTASWLATTEYLQSLTIIMIVNDFIMDSYSYS